MQKTGSTFVNRFLTECSLLKLRKHKKHMPIGEEFSDDTFYFITIRHPVALYSSLFRYGLDSRGGVYNLLNRRGLTECYSSFEAFVEFVCDPRNASHLSGGYTESIAEEMGFMSFRFLKLSLQNPMQQIESTLAEGGRLLDLAENFITGLEIKNEALVEGLEGLAAGKLSEHFDKEKVSSFLGGHEKVNASTSTHETVGGESGKLTAVMLEKEGLLLSRYGSSA